jgi:hypothetical protein
MQKLFHITDSLNRDSISKKGIVASKGWISGAGVFLTAKPLSWIHMFEPDGVYPAESVDVWEVDARGLPLVEDDHESADPGVDFIAKVAAIVPARLKIAQTYTLME